MTAHPPDDVDLAVDYAVPAAVESGRKRPPREPVQPGDLWGGRPRTALLAGCWGLSGLLAVVLLVALLRSEQPGADTPEAAVTRLLQGIADTDPVAIVAAIDPAETDDPSRAGAAYDRLSSRLLRQGEVPPLDVTAVLAAAESQVDGSVDLDAVATVAALDLALDGLDLRAEPDPDDLDARRVYVVAGDLDVALDPGRLPESRAGLGKTSYSMPLAEGWTLAGRDAIEPFLVAVERDGRWYVSLESSADALVGPADGPRIAG